jgi:hypothetical protein
MKSSSLQSYFINAGKWSCLAEDYIYAIVDYLIQADEATKLNIVNTALYAAFINKTGIDEEFFVSNPKLLIEKTASSIGKQVNVSISKKDISSLKDLPEKGYAAVRFDFNGNSHFVLYKDRNLFFNGLEDSKCFKYGKMTTARIIEIERIV